MNNFLSDMQSLVLYKHITDLSKSKKDKNKSIEEQEIQLEMIKLKKAISSSPSPSNAPKLYYKDYSSSIAKINSPVINANENIKDTLAKDSGLQSLVSKASSQSTIGNASSQIQSAGSSSLQNYGATFSSSNVNPIPTIKQFGLVKMTGTEGKNENGYTIGKGAKERASASLDYITRDENDKPISDIKDKDGNVVSKVDAKEHI